MDLEINRPLSRKEVECEFENLNPYSFPGLSSKPKEFLGTQMTLSKATKDELSDPVHKL